MLRRQKGMQSISRWVVTTIPELQNSHEQLHCLWFSGFIASFSMYSSSKSAQLAWQLFAECTGRFAQLRQLQSHLRS